MQIKQKTDQSNKSKEVIQYDLSKRRNGPPILNAIELEDIAGGGVNFRNKDYWWKKCGNILELIKENPKLRKQNSIYKDKTLLTLWTQRADLECKIFRNRTHAHSYFNTEILNRYRDIWKIQPL